MNYRKPLIIAIPLFIFLLFGTAVLLVLNLSCPNYSDLFLPSIQCHQFEENGKTYLRVDGDQGSPAGQIQEISYELDLDRKVVKVYSYFVVWHPFSRVASHRRWPLVINVEPISHGIYSVECFAAGKFEHVGTFTNLLTQSRR
jgi:hypothetical protein